MTYYYQRELSRSETLRALGIGAGAGIGVGVAVAAAGFYFARIMMQRTPLRGPAGTTPPPAAPLEISIVRKAP